MELNEEDITTELQYKRFVVFPRKQEVEIIKKTEEEVFSRSFNPHASGKATAHYSYRFS
jgi:hypothetical protein